MHAQTIKPYMSLTEQSNLDGTSTITLNAPWGVTPVASESVITCGLLATDIVGFENTLRGDGVLCYQGSDCGFNVVGTNIILDDNDVSGTAAGIVIFEDPTETANAFNIYSDNSFHQVEVGVAADGVWYNVGATGPWFFGNVFRQNIVAGIITTGSGSAYACGFAFLTNAGTSDLDPNQLLMNVMDSNIVAGAHYAFRFISTTLSGPGGVVDTVLWNNFASSDGFAGSSEIWLSVGDTGSQPYLDEITNIWQLFSDGPDSMLA